MNALKRPRIVIDTPLADILDDQPYDSELINVGNTFEDSFPEMTIERGVDDAFNAYRITIPEIGRVFELYRYPTPAGHQAYWGVVVRDLDDVQIGTTRSTLGWLNPGARNTALFLAYMHREG